MLNQNNKQKALRHLEELLRRYPVLETAAEPLQSAFEAAAKCYEQGGKLLVCGNGGSAADADHIVGELMKGFYKLRPLSERDAAGLGEHAALLQGALPAISLTQHTALSTAFLNDVDPTMVFAQQVYGYGKPGDVFMGISTSGKAKNVVAAAEVAKARGLCTIGLTGKDGGRLAQVVTHCIQVPEKVTAYVQELHLPVYHAFCAMLEEYFF